MKALYINDELLKQSDIIAKYHIYIPMNVTVSDVPFVNTKAYMFYLSS